MNIQSLSSSLPPTSGAETGSVAREARIATSAAIQETSAAANAAGTQPVSSEQLSAAIDSVREYIQPFNSDLQFSVNDETNRVIVTVVDSETKEVIRQIPSEEMLAMAKALDNIKGLFIKQQA